MTKIESHTIKLVDRLDKLDWPVMVEKEGETKSGLNMSRFEYKVVDVGAIEIYTDEVNMKVTIDTDGIHSIRFYGSEMDTIIDEENVVGFILGTRQYAEYIKYRRYDR